MSRSPASPPVGKRLKTMTIGDQDELQLAGHSRNTTPQMVLYRQGQFDSIDVVDQSEGQTTTRKSPSFKENSSETNGTSSDHSTSHTTNTNDLGASDSDDGSTSANLESLSDEINDEEYDEEAEDDDEDEESQDSIDAWHWAYHDYLESLDGFSRDSLDHESAAPDLDDDDEDYYESETDDDIDFCSPEEYLKHDPTPETQYPKPDWITIKELRQRQCGITSSRYPHARHSNMRWFEQYARNSLWMIQRLEYSKSLKEHRGCVNSVSFNSTGRLLCSGSDDLCVCIWDWERMKLVQKLNRIHQYNILHCLFCNSDKDILTSSRDATVCLSNIETGVSTQLLSTTGEIRETALLTPQTIVTCDTNGCVHYIDLRVRNPINLFSVKIPDSKNRLCPLYSISPHPLDKHKIVVGGSSPYVYFYDLRRIKQNINEFSYEPIYCIDKSHSSLNMITSTAFNSTGDKLLISYNDYDLVVCQANTCEIIHRYRGHRNRKTIKECAWFGDNYVISGSDDGYIYGWDLKSEHIVCFLKGDKEGAVNSLSVHPNIPILASSGIDPDVKIWEPTSRTWPQTLKGIKSQICKNTMRRKKAQESRRHWDQEIENEL